MIPRIHLKSYLMHTDRCVLVVILMEIGMLNFWLGSLVTALMKETCFTSISMIIRHYSRLRNKHRGTLINFGTFFQGLCSLLERAMYIFFQNILCLMVWGMPISRATLNIFAKCSVGYVYSRGYSQTFNVLLSTFASNSRVISLEISSIFGSFFVKLSKFAC